MRSLAIDDLLGLPYRQGGRLPGDGTDCFGLIVECCRRAGRPIPDPFLSAEQPTDARQWIVERLAGWRRCEVPTAGCVVELRSHAHPAHVGYMLDEREFVHSVEGAGVVVSRIDRDPWKYRILGVYAYHAD